MSRYLLHSCTLVDNPHSVQWFSWWFCLRFYVATQVVYFAQVTNSLFRAAILLVIIQISQASLEVVTGVLSDTVGRVWTLRLQVAVSAASIVFYVVGGSFIWLMAGAIGDGAWRALMSGNTEALVYESARQCGQRQRFPQYLATMNMVMELGGFVSMAIGGFLATLGFRWALCLTLMMHLPAFMVSLRLVEPMRHREGRYVNPWRHFSEAVTYMRKNRVLRNLSLSQVMTNGLSTFELWPALYATFFPLWLVGILYSANYLESAIGFRASGWFMRRYAPMQILFGGELYARFMFIPALIFPSPATPALMALAGAPYGPMTVALGAVVHEEYTDHQRATMASITSFLGNCLYAVFTLVLGLVADQAGPGRAILIGQICLLPVLWVYWRLYRTKVNP